MSSGKRISLVDAVKDIDVVEPVTPLVEPAEATAPPVTESKPAAKKPAPTSSSGAAAKSTLQSVKPEPASTPVPRARIYDKLDRKEARLRTDQYSQLTTLSRDLNHRRNREGERITENTLIRVAIDMLLTKKSDLAGATEDELRRSMGL